MEILTRLGEELDDHWREHNYDELAFSSLATEALERNHEALERIEALDLLEWVSRAPRLPSQTDASSGFGDMALTLFETSRFFVSCLYWVDGSTAIHQHRFSGAFRVLAGGSIHTRFDFREEQRINSAIRLGRIETKEIELLTKGSVRPIEAGDAFIHSLYHLERPSLTLVVRTGNEPGSEPQWSYDPSGIAVDPFQRYDRVSSKKVEAARMLLMIEPERALAELRAMLATADVQFTYQLLNDVRQQMRGNALSRHFERDDFEGALAPLLELARERHGELVDRIEKSFEERDRQEHIIFLRQQMTAPEQRFLLALLLNFPGKDPVLELLRERYPDRDPVEEFVERVHDLASTRVLGAKQGNLLEVEHFDVEHRIVLKRLLQGGSVADAAADLVAGLGDPADEAARVAAEMEAELRAAPLLRALFENA